MPEYTLDITEEEYQKAGSKFITYPPSDKPMAARKGEIQYRDITVGMVDWDTPGQSMKVPVTITEEGVDKDKEDKISFGVKVDSIWKGKEIYHAITGDDMPMKKGSDGKKHPSINPMLLAGQEAVGMWQIVEGKKGGAGEATYYPKLVTILPKGSRPKVESLGI